MRFAATALPNRGLLFLKGPDLKDFLQGLVTNDVGKALDGNVIYAALLTPQGKYLFDFFLIPHDGGLILDSEANRLGDLKRRLMMYRLRSKVEITDITEKYKVYAAEQAPDTQGLICFPDPRHETLGYRLLVPTDLGASITELPFDAYEEKRIALGIADGSKDLDIEKTLILEGNFEPLHGVEFQKGCYVGQELTARMKHRGKVRKRLFSVSISGEHPSEDTDISLDGRSVGTMKSRTCDKGLALLRTEDLEKAPFQWGEATVTPQVQPWLKPYLSS
ncbi:MAG: folate-binding protein [Sphingomonadales bacterium]|jgi:folate-binding protein YgfZ